MIPIRVFLSEFLSYGPLMNFFIRGLVLFSSHRMRRSFELSMFDRSLPPT